MPVGSVMHQFSIRGLFSVPEEKRNSPFLFRFFCTFIDLTRLFWHFSTFSHLWTFKSFILPRNESWPSKIKYQVFLCPFLLGSKILYSIVLAGLEAG